MKGSEASNPSSPSKRKGAVGFSEIKKLPKPGAMLSEQSGNLGTPEGHQRLFCPSCTKPLLEVSPALKRRRYAESRACRSAKSRVTWRRRRDGSRERACQCSENKRLRGNQMAAQEPSN